MGLTVARVSAAESAKYLSPESLVAAPDGKRLYIADVTGARIQVFDLQAGRVTREIGLPGSPGGLALSPDGARLYVSEAAVEGRAHEIDLKSGRLLRHFAVGHTPTAVSVGSGGKTLFVCNRFDDDVSIVDLASGKETGRLPVVREPVAAGLSRDGARLLVVNQLPSGAATAPPVASAVSILDVKARKVVKNVKLPNGSTGARGIAFSPDGKFAYVTHVLARYGLPTTQLDRGWVATSAVSVIDVAGARYIDTFLLDNVMRGAANPWGIDCSADGKWLCVTHAGTHEVSVINRAKVHEKLDAAKKAGAEKSSGAIVAPVNDLAFLVGMRKRVKLEGNGPRGLVVAGGMACAVEYFSGTLAVLDLAVERAKAKSVSLGDQKAMSQARRGEMLFHDAEHCFQQWLSCATCHPTDGRVDALNWDLLLDGVGNPKNTKSLLHSHQTPPTTFTGARPNAEASVRAGIRFIEFVVRPEEDAAAIDDYLRTLGPVASPRLANGRLSAAAERGKEVYRKAECARCHRAPYHTDQLTHRVGTGKGREKETPFVTPSLTECWRTAPYLHDGSAATIKDMLLKHNEGDAHGKTSGLTAKEIEDLVEYVLSL